MIVKVQAFGFFLVSICVFRERPTSRRMANGFKVADGFVEVGDLRTQVAGKPGVPRTAVAGVLNHGSMANNL